MKNLFHKLNYRGQERILIINAEKRFLRRVRAEIPGLKVDAEIDPRFPYEFMLIFVKFMKDVEELAPRAVHNLVADGVIWFAFPKYESLKPESDLDRDHGWEIMLQRGFDKVRQVNIDDNWTALRFRNIRYIKSDRFKLQ